jgi:hypothetical protein
MQENILSTYSASRRGAPQSNLQIISYDLATIPTTPMMPTYDLQGKVNKPRHIHVSPLKSISGSAIIALRKEPHYISVLQAAEKEDMDEVMLHDFESETATSK